MRMMLPMHAGGIELIHATAPGYAFSGASIADYSPPGLERRRRCNLSSEQIVRHTLHAKNTDSAPFGESTMWKPQLLRPFSTSLSVCRVICWGLRAPDS